LVTGVALYLIALAASLLAIDTEAGDRSARVLLLLPIIAPALMILLGPTVFLVGMITGTPLVSFTYGLSAMKRNWRSIAGFVLLLAVLLATLVAARS
jgi:multisubunit Na+/H+ antiporter MnhE subunit